MAENVRTDVAAGPASAGAAPADGTPPPAARRRPGRGSVTLLVVLLLAVVAGAGAATIHARQSPAAGPPSGPPWTPTASPSTGPTPTGTGLRSLAPANLRIGSAVEMKLLDADPRFRDTFTTNFNALTAENAMKWRNLEPTRGGYNWAPSDQLVEFGQAHGQAVYGHTLVWHTAVPSWIDESWDTETIRDLLRNHVSTVVGRYRGKVWAWDVVNEVLDEQGGLRDTIWLRKLGPGYIADAFRWAHEADPNARLFINEYGTEGRTRKADGLFRLVRELRAVGVPVHGVGFQSHLRWDRTPDDTTGNLRRFADLGVSVAITEMDVRITLQVTTEKLQRQERLYRHMLRACLTVPTCESFTVWGFSDATSWINTTYPDHGAACVFDADLEPKPAYDALVETLRERRGRVDVPSPGSG
ncbi:endo-1,4-beta-xylanase [Micromonospora fluostatini]|uniref:Beta-xylanase n=2 Tax=Micromonospora TaxID=1873 RepID=A0ABY2DGW0_9ACTN|nr:endo-1,4-beta-xylanase [Micromonospora fluostatini]